MLAVPAGLALDRWPRPALAVGAVLTALGGVVRLGGDGFGWALAGQLMVAVAQPLVLNAITGVVGVLPARSRPTGIAVGSAGLFLGMVLALGAGAVVGGDHLVALATGQAVLGVLVTVVFLVVSAVRRRSRPTLRRPRRPAYGVWTDPILRRIAVLAFLGFGVFVALITLAASVAGAERHLGVCCGRDHHRGSRGGSRRVDGAVGVLEGRSVEVTLLRSALIGAVAGCCLLAAASGLVLATAGTMIAVLAMLTALPWLLALCERRAGVRRECDGPAVARGQSRRLVVAVAVGGLVDQPTVAFLLLAVVALIGLPLVRRDRLIGDQPVADSLALSPEQGR